VLKIWQAAVNWQFDAVFAPVMKTPAFVFSYERIVFEVPTTASERFNVLVVTSAAVFVIQKRLFTK